MDVLIQKPGEIIRPNVNSAQIRNILTKLYGLNPLEISELNSYEDKNFHIKNATLLPNSQIKKISSFGYTLKILNSMESQNPKLIEAQNHLMIYLHKNGIKCPIPVKTIVNEDYTVLDLNTMKDEKTECKSENKNIVRLLTFIPGQLLGNTEYTIQVFSNTGQYLSELHEVMKNFHHSEFNARQSLWSMASFPHIVQFLHVVKDASQVNLVEEIIKEFREKVETNYNKLTKGLIHGDFNEQNILIEKTEGKNIKIVGVLDFADVQNSFYVFDIAIAIMYLMLESNDIDPLQVGGHFLAGYCTKRTLDPSEWEILKICVAARFCVSLVMGLYNNTLDNKNDYVLITQKKGWKILENFWSTPEKNLLYLWKIIMSTKTL